MDRRDILKLFGAGAIAGHIKSEGVADSKKRTKRVLFALFVTCDSGTYPFSRGDMVEVDPNPENPFGNVGQNPNYVTNAKQWGVFVKGCKFPFNKRAVRIIELDVVDE